MTDYKPLDLVPIIERNRHRSPGPWKVGHCDDERNMSAVFVYSGEGPENTYPDADLVKDAGKSVIAVTLYQQPRIADHKDELWEENADFIAGASADVPALLDEVVRLRREVALRDHYRPGTPCWSFLMHAGAYRLLSSACPTCRAASLDGWDPSKSLDWKPEAK